MTAAAFARELALRLSGVLPHGFSAWADDDAWVWLGAPDGHDAGTWTGMIQKRRDDPRAYTGTAESVLSHAQDVVSETTGDPWPRALGSRLDLALPASRLDEHMLHMWYGDERNPVLRLAPIDLSAIQDA